MFWVKQVNLHCNLYSMSTFDGTNVLFSNVGPFKIPHLPLAAVKKNQGISHSLGAISKFFLQSLFYANFLRYYCVIPNSHSLPISTSTFSCCKKCEGLSIFLHVTCKLGLQSLIRVRFRRH